MKVNADIRLKIWILSKFNYKHSKFSNIFLVILNDSHPIFNIILVGDELFPTDRMLQASRYSIDISMEIVQMNCIL